MTRIIVGISGASGIVLAQKAVRKLIAMDHDVCLVMTQAACCTTVYELDIPCRGPEVFCDLSFTAEERKAITTYHIQDFGAPIASGSYPAYGMLVVPCSMTTLAAVACGIADNLLRRACDVSLKERRPLVLVPREAPLSELHLQNMLTVARLGGVIVPPVPAWYMKPKTLSDAEDFIVGKALEALKLDNVDYPRWKSG
ncbi:UbiX family flavin prenyltransferase [Simkania negevensis]|uniref:Flavin prenyltransferase UbiX n=1 Tax=Simkania negevensis TaxID=83561 RepID=A0ABS3AQU2_9BACT|nr:UbiX family flavin prenyltransferase [Simkania negevensis]